jgi:RNA polymerase sigma factor (sigma-70 family)
LRLESLEHRTLPASVFFHPLALPVGAAEVRIASVAPAQTPSNSADPHTAIDSSSGATAFDGAGLARLVRDLRQLPEPAADLPIDLGNSGGVAAPGAPFLGTPSRGHGLAGLDAKSSTNPLDDGPMAAPPARPTPPPVSPGIASSTAELTTGIPQDARPSVDAVTIAELQGLATSGPSNLGQTAYDFPDSWTPPQTPVECDGVNLAPVVEHGIAAFANPWQDGAAPVSPTAPSVPVEIPQFPAIVATSTETVMSSGCAGRPELPELDTADAAMSRAGANAGINVSSRELSDGVLLERFVVHRDQAAFAALVQRHERLVFGVCQRVLGDPQAAQDAVQATFLVLARKAGALDLRRPLASWLYLVAYHVALRLRAAIARQRRCEIQAARNRPTHDGSAGAAEIEDQEIYQVLRDELARLPDKYRVPLALCYFDGRTHADAARAIGMPRGSIAKRIGEGLERLRQRLLDRGISL